jgi:CRP-like cAMP-binding protein
MNTFLTKISQLASIQEVLFLSVHGELLFPINQEKSKETDSSIALWNMIIDDLHAPVEAELFFEKGGYYLHSTDMGYIIIGMYDFSRLSNIKTASANLESKLSDPAVGKKVLLRMLHEAGEAMKPPLVRALSPFAGDDIAGTLIDLLEKSVRSGSGIRGDLLGSICRILGRCRSSAARRTLKKVLREHSAGAIVLEDESRQAAQVALAQLELDLPPESDTQQPPKDSAVRKAGQEDEPSVAVLSAPKKNQVPEVPEGPKIQKLLDQNRKDEAIALILEQIEFCAEKKQFDLAEQLREWIIQVDSSSLREIIRAAEIIEEEKNASIGGEHLKTWETLANALSIEDYSSLYHTMVHRQYVNGQIVVDQGKFDSTLFFVNRGRVQLYSAGQTGEHPLKVVGAGEIFGVESFFDISIWTVSARSLGADLSLLTWDRLLKLKEASPALQTKLMDFCSRYRLTNLAFNKASTTRRRFERVKVSGKVAVSLVKNQGKENLSGSKGNLVDISRGGLAFSLRFSKKKNAVALLGEDVRVVVRTDVSAQSVDRTGVVKAVQCHDYVGNDYTIHLEFKKALSSSEVWQAVGRKR